ncbi:MAG: RNA polymerase sigma factor, partial [Vulcanimicrobiaceae bacterium]
VEAFEALYSLLYRYVYGIANRMLEDMPAAEDVTQSVFVTVWAQPSAFRGGNVAAWISRVTRNRCLDYLRNRGTRPHEELPFDVADEVDLDDVVFARLESGQVRQALETLPSEQREPIEMGFFGGLTHEEVARRSGIPLGTVKTRIRIGLRNLRAALQDARVR